MDAKSRLVAAVAESKTRQECQLKMALKSAKSSQIHEENMAKNVANPFLPWKEKSGPPGSTKGLKLRWRLRCVECLEGQWYAWNGTKNLENARRVSCREFSFLLHYTLPGLAETARSAQSPGHRSSERQVENFIRDAPTLL